MTLAGSFKPICSSSRHDVCDRPDCPADPVAAHKWFNIAAIKGCDRAAEVRVELAATMSKRDLAEALRAARDWMATH